MPVVVDGEILQDDEVRKLIKFVNDVAYEMAGQFHGLKRSKRFRKTWPSEYRFAEENWKNFIEGARAMLADTLNKYQSGIVKGSPEEADKIHKALIVQAMMSEAKNAETAPIQLAPGSQGYDGDKTENRITDESFGVGNTADHLKSRMLRTAKRFH